MRNLVLVLGDQLTDDLSSLRNFDKDLDIVLMVEVRAEAIYVNKHKQKIAFVLSAMRHFARALRARGFPVDYVEFEDEGNTGDFTGELKRALARHAPQRVLVTEPGEWRVLDIMRGWQSDLDIPVIITPDDRFFCSRDEFAEWARGRKAFRMEHFYRQMRQRTGILMEDGKPVAGQWNFDVENRKTLPRGEMTPPRLRFEPDALTSGVIDLVERHFSDHFGSLETFGWAVTRNDALAALAHFLADCLPRFGDYQDAMKAGEPFLYHSIVSPYLNIGLLTAEEVCARAVEQWQAGRAPINAVEGFVRQILGWREYVRGLYFHLMPRYQTSNHLDADRPLPWFYWSGETEMRCVSATVEDTRQHAYAHHIQRLMVTGNFALLAGLRPAEVEAWYLAVYIDAFEWVELPNVHGMALFADGGLLASKPYAASGAYIDRMSDYCGTCSYDPKLKTGPSACPFNYLYWNFLMVNRDRLAGNPRLTMPFRILDQMTDAHRQNIASDAATFLQRMDQPPQDLYKAASYRKSRTGSDRPPVGIVMWDTVHLSESASLARQSVRCGMGCVANKDTPMKHLISIAAVLAASLLPAQAAPYTLFIYEKADQLALRPATDDAAAAYWSAYDVFGKALAEAGVLRGGSALTTEAPVSLVEAGIERPSSAPYASSALALGGYFQIEVATDAEAIAWARKMPAVGGMIEVRAGYPVPGMKM